MRKLGYLAILLLLCAACVFAQSIFIPGPGLSRVITNPATCGNTNAPESFAEGGWAGFQLAGAQCTPSNNVTVVDCKIYQLSVITNAALTCVVWDSNGTYAGSVGEPGTLICSGSATTTTSGTWLTITPSGCGTLTSGHAYWVGMYQATNVTSLSKDNVNTGRYITVGGVGHPITFAGAGTVDKKFSMYLDVQ